MRHWFLKCYARNLQGIRTRSVHLCCHPRFPGSMTMGGHLLLVLITILASSVSGYVNAEHDSIPRDSISVTDLRVNDLGEKGSDGYLQLFVEETSWYNSIVLGSLLPRRIWSPLPHALQSWTRNYVAGNILYFVSGGLWCFYIYYLKRHVYFPKDGIPSKEPIFMQIMVSMKAMPLYCALPVLSEFMVEKGWTRCFARLSEVGLPAYIFLTILYLVLVEFGIYWMHRELHDIKPLYKYLHATHHIYNKQNTLSPFAEWENSMTENSRSQELESLKVFRGRATEKHKIGFQSLGWHIAGSSTCDCPVSCPNTLFHPYGTSIL